MNPERDPRRESPHSLTWPEVAALGVIALMIVAVVALVVVWS